MKIIQARRLNASVYFPSASSQHLALNELVRIKRELMLSVCSQRSTIAKHALLLSLRMFRTPRVVRYRNAFAMKEAQHEDPSMFTEASTSIAIKCSSDDDKTRSQKHEGPRKMWPKVGISLDNAD